MRRVLSNVTRLHPSIMKIPLCAHRLGARPGILSQEFSMPLTQIRSLAVKLAGAAFVVAGAAGAQQIKNAIPDAARPLPLSAVRLTGGPLKQAQDLDADYLLKLEPDRMMAYYRKRAGLEPKAEGYTGWDGDGRNLTGHIAGHYLSAVSFMYAATGDPRFKERADYIVREMKEVQDKQGDGYIGALMASPPRNRGGTNAPAGGGRRGGSQVVDGKDRFN